MRLKIPDMTCGHCKATVERAVTTLDSNADVVVDLPGHTADISTTAPAEAVLNALKAEGYDATVIG